MDFDHHRGPDQPGPPRYVMLSEHNRSGGDGPSNLRPPPHRRNLPRYHSHRSDNGWCGCGCLCWCCCFLLLFIIFTVAAIAYMYIVFDPQPPNYSINNLSIGALDFRPDLTLHTQLSVTLRAENPNTMIGISYGSGSQVVVSYKSTPLCSGHLPSFYQGHRNTTVLKVVMEGRVAYGTELKEALEENKVTGEIPLDIYVRVPIGLRLGEVALRQITVIVNCDLVVDGITPKQKTGIKSAHYKVDVKF